MPLRRPLSPLEIASGFLLPAARRDPPLPPPGGPTPRAALEAALAPALRDGPFLVSFSGGRDSSAVLAVAAHVARRERLAPPVPATIRFPGASGTQESAWQESVVRHLGLDDWIRIELRSELDCVGPVAADVLARHGVLWPCNAYFHAPLFAHARGGSLATGLGGDEAFSASTWARQAAVLRGAVRPAPRDVPRVAFALAPPAVKERLLRSQVPAVSPWLQPEARRAVARSLAREAGSEPVRWAARFRWLHGSPYLAAGRESLGLLAADAGARALHPFLEPGFLAALAALPPERRHTSRSEAMTRLVGDLLPPALLGRGTKARFDVVLWQHHSRELLASWDGEGVDPDLVDIARLRTELAADPPDAHASALAQQIWLARAGGGAGSVPGELEQALGGRG